MATPLTSSVQSKEEEESPKPRLTRIRSLLNSNTSRGETITSAPHVTGRRVLRSSGATERSRPDERSSSAPYIWSRDWHCTAGKVVPRVSRETSSFLAASSQPLSQVTCSLSRQPTLELTNMEDSTEKPALEKRRSSRLAKSPLDSLPIEETYAPVMTKSPSSRSLTRSASRSTSRATSILSKSASIAKASGSSGSSDEEATPDTGLSKTASIRMSRSASKRTLSKTASTAGLTTTKRDSASSAGEDRDRSPKAKDADKDSNEEPMETDSDPVPDPSPIPGPSDPFGPSDIELVISFDTTGSMSSCINEVRKCVQDVVQRLFMDIPSLKISIIAHGDYCDESTYYVLKQVDFTNDVASLCQFVKDVGGSGGGDFDECYEYVLHHVRNMTWTPGTQRALVMIGDATPHEPDYHLNKLNLNWRDEADKLREDLGVRIYAVQCQDNGANVAKFYQSLANRTQGRYLRLNKFSTIVDILMAICYREKGAEFFEAFEMEVRDRDGRHLATELDSVFDTLRAPGTSKPKKVYDLSKGAGKKPKGATAGKPRKPKTDIPKKSPKRLSPAERKATKTASEGRKPRKNKIVRIDREKLPASKFILNKLRWSKWHVVMCEKRLGSSCSWVPNTGYPGEYNRYVFHDTEVQAVYEFAIQHKKRGKRYVMYTTCSRGFPKSTTWFKKFFARKSSILGEIPHLMNSSGILSMRRAVLPRSCTVKLQNGSKKKLKVPRDYTSLLNKVYNYAWQVGPKKPIRTKRFAPCLPSS